jgi:hypothetical protein
MTQPLSKQLGSRLAELAERLGRRRRPSRRRAGLLLETLEQRCVPAVFNVNSPADILNPPAGVVTLRAAIQAANASPGGNTINLTVAGAYKITIPGAGEDANATGDFDILSTGGNLTIQNTSGGKVPAPRCSSRTAPSPATRRPATAAASRSTRPAPRSSTVRPSSTPPSPATAP